MLLSCTYFRSTANFQFLSQVFLFLKIGEGNITLAMRHFLTSMWFRKGEVKTTQSLNPSKVLGAVGQMYFFCLFLIYFLATTLLIYFYFREQRFRKRNQQDANELFVCLVNGLRDEEVKRIKKEKKESGEGEEEEERVDGYIEPPPTFVDEIFGGELHSICTCLKCDRGFFFAFITLSFNLLSLQNR